MLVSPSTAMDVLSYHLSDGRYNITQFHLKYWRETQLLGSELQPNGRHLYDMQKLMSLAEHSNYARIPDFFVGEMVLLHAVAPLRSLPCFLDDGTKFSESRGCMFDDGRSDEEFQRSLFCGVAVSDSNADKLVENHALICTFVRGFTEPRMIGRVTGWQLESGGTHKVIRVERAEQSLIDRIGSGTFFDTANLAGSTDSVRVF